MGKKRKQPQQQQAVAPLPVVEAEPPRKRTLLGLVTPPCNGTTAPEKTTLDSEAPVAFRNKEKSLVLCSRRITFRCVCLNLCCFVGELELYLSCCSIISLSCSAVVLRAGSVNVFYLN